MRTHYVVGNRRFSASSSHDSAFLSNPSGFFFLPCMSPWSKYQGWHAYLPTMPDPLKLVDSLAVVESGPAQETALTVSPGAYLRIARTYPDGKKTEESYAIGDGVLRYSCRANAPVPIALALDVRPINAFPDFGRIVDILEVTALNSPKGKGRTFRVRYQQFEDAQLLRKRSEIIIALRIEGAGVSVVGSWTGREYPFDAARNSRASAYVYDALRFTIQPPLGIAADAQITLSYGTDEDEAFMRLERRITVRHSDLLPPALRGLPAEGRNLALLAAATLGSLSGKLGEGHPAIRAGLPWFYRVWLRDELLSLDGLIATQQYATVKLILERTLSLIGESGLLPSHLPQSDLASIDAPALLSWRIKEFITTLEREKKLASVYTRKELALLRERLFIALVAYEKSRGETLILARPLESWMDTGSGNDVRSGACVELQALHLTMLDCIILLGNLARDEGDGDGARPVPAAREPDHIERRRAGLCEYIRARLHDPAQGILADTIKEDGTVDRTARPNVFLARHFCPSLFSQEEWKRIFDAALRSLWLEWGGVASIAKDHPLFTPRYTGEDNKSYHRGDSWLFINNIAAIEMLAVDPLAYHEQASAILRASSTLLLSRGTAGSISELSSAERLVPAGCPVQAWSLSTYVALLARVTEQTALFPALTQAFSNPS